MKLRYYETFYLLHPDLTEEDRAAISEKLQRIVMDRGGQIVEISPWPLQKLAYRVKKQTQGYYVLMQYGAPPDVISDLTTTMRLDDRVLKFITVKKAERFDPKALAKARENPVPPESGDEEATNPVQDPETIEE